MTGGSVSIAGGISLDTPDPSLVLNAAGAANQNAIYGRKGGLNRWVIVNGQGSTEPGGDAGSDFFIGRYSDAGGWLGIPLSISRQTGNITITSNLSISSGLSVTGNFVANAGSEYGFSSFGPPGSYFVPRFMSATAQPTYLQFGPSDAPVEFNIDGTGNFNVNHTGLAAGVFSSIRAGCVAGTLRLQNGNAQFGGKITVAAKGSSFGLPAGTAAWGAVTPIDANIQIYYLSETNWAGIGADGSGNMWFRTGVGATSPAPGLWIGNDQSVNASRNLSVGGGTFGPYSFVAYNSAPQTMAAIYTGTPGPTFGPTINQISINPPTAAGDRVFATLGGVQTSAGNSTQSVGFTGYASQAWTPGSAQGAYLDLQSTPNGTVTRRAAIRVQQSGGVSIGPSAVAVDPGQDNLYVYGGMGVGSLSVGGISVYGNIPTVLRAGPYTCVAADANTCVGVSSGLVTIPANASVAYPVGTVITFMAIGGGSAITIAVAADTMYLAGVGTTGTRTLANTGIATALKYAATQWVISGSGLT
jgi:hypothetical protein